MKDIDKHTRKEKRGHIATLVVDVAKSDESIHFLNGFSGELKGDIQTGVLEVKERNSEPWSISPGVKGSPVSAKNALICYIIYSPLN